MDKRLREIRRLTEESLEKVEKFERRVSEKRWKGSLPAQLEVKLRGIYKNILKIILEYETKEGNIFLHTSIAEILKIVKKLDVKQNG